MPTPLISITTLRANLGRYVRRAERGHRIVITVRGKAVAELRPLLKGVALGLNPGLPNRGRPISLDVIDDRR